METIVSAGVPEVAVGQTVPASEGAPSTFSGKWSDFAKDMAVLQAEQGQPEQPKQIVIDRPAQAPVTQPVQPAEPSQQTPAVTQPVTPAAVPEKFLTPDGKVDQEKLLKSYGEAERTLKRLQNQVSGQPVQQAQAPAPQQAQAPIQLTPFEAQVAQDIFTQSGGPQNGGFTEQQAIAMARVQVRMLEAKHQADTAVTLSKVAQFEQTLEEQNRRNELSSLAKNQPWVMTPQGLDELRRVREENPLINQAQEPWKAAVIYLLGQRQLQGISGQVDIPTPTATQQAPAMPAIAAQRTAAPMQLNTPSEVQEYVKTLTPEQEAQFWQKAGYKWEAPRKQYMGI